MQYDFGYLPWKARLTFVGGTIEPHVNFEEARKWIAKYSHRDGFIYPPIVEQGDESGNRFPNTERPAHLFRLPPSHVLTLSTLSGIDSEREDASFVIHLLGYYFGGWYQFADWWFDTRVPLKTHNITQIQSVAEDFLSHSWNAWTSWSNDAKRRFANILFMSNRAPAYEWDWEQFVISYMVFDGCYRMAREMDLVSEVPHSNRLAAMCDAFGIPHDDCLMRRIITLRNNLFHETLWANGRPGSAGGAEDYFAPLHLRRLNQRLIPALLGYDIPYVRTAWWTLGTCAFDPQASRVGRAQRNPPSSR